MKVLISTMEHESISELLQSGKPAVPTIIPAIVMFDFDAKGANELSARSQERVQLLYEINGWAFAKTPDGRRGYIPTKFCKLDVAKFSQKQQSNSIKQDNKPTPPRNPVIRIQKWQSFYNLEIGEKSPDNQTQPSPSKDITASCPDLRKDNSEVCYATVATTTEDLDESGSEASRQSLSEDDGISMSIASDTSSTETSKYGHIKGIKPVERKSSQRVAYIADWFKSGRTLAPKAKHINNWLQVQSAKVYERISQQHQKNNLERSTDISPAVIYSTERRLSGASTITEYDNINQQSQAQEDISPISDPVTADLSPAHRAMPEQRFRETPPQYLEVVSKTADPVSNQLVRQAIQRNTANSLPTEQHNYENHTLADDLRFTDSYKHFKNIVKPEPVIREETPKPKKPLLRWFATKRDTQEQKTSNLKTKGNISKKKKVRFATTDDFIATSTHDYDDEYVLQTEV